MTKALIKAEEIQHRVILPMTEDSRTTMFRLAETVVQSGIAEKKFQNNPASVFICMMYGRDLGISEMQSLKEVNVIEGLPSISANLMIARIRQYAPHALFDIVKSDETICEIKVRRNKGDEVKTEIYTMKESGHLAHKINWKNHPKDMLFNRCVSRVYRRYFSDLSMGIIYTADEATEAAGDNQEPASTKPGDQAEAGMKQTAGAGVASMPRAAAQPAAAEGEAAADDQAPEPATPADEVVIDATPEPEDTPTADERPEGISEEEDSALTDLAVVLFETKDSEGVEHEYGKFRQAHSQNKKVLIEAYKLLKKRQQEMENQ